MKAEPWRDSWRGQESPVSKAAERGWDRDRFGTEEGIGDPSVGCKETKPNGKRRLGREEVKTAGLGRLGVRNRVVGGEGGTDPGTVRFSDHGGNRYV